MHESLSPLLDTSTTRLSSVLTPGSGVAEVVRLHVHDVLRICSVPDDVVVLAGSLAGQTVEQTVASSPGPLDVEIEVSATTVTVTVTGDGDSLFDGLVLPRSRSRAGVTSGVRWKEGRTSAWFGVGHPGRPARAEAPGPRALVEITHALSVAETLGAVSAGVATAVRAHLGAAFAGVAVLDPLAAGSLRYVSMDPLPVETARDWAEITIDDTSPLGAAVAQRRATFFDSPASAEQSFPGISQHMRTAGVASMAHVPLSAGETVIGTLAISYAEEHVFEPEERALLTTVAAYTAVAVARCRGPAPEPVVPVRRDEVPESGADEGRPLRVLIVDDTADIRELLGALFGRRSDVQVVAEARDGQEAIELAAALQPDIVVLDVAMPVLDGISALPYLVAAAPNARVVMLSALPAEFRAPVALAVGATAYVEKTTAVATLVDDLLEAANLLDAAVRRLTEEADQQLDNDPRQIQRARHFVTDALDRWEQSELADTVVLLLSELVTNAVVHAGSAPRVSVRLLPDRVHVEVTDQGQDDAQPRPLTSEETSGRGLAIVDALAMGWGTALVPPGKVVWFDVARDA